MANDKQEKAEEIRKLLDSAKREPAHSPVEDALIDSIEMLLELVEEHVEPSPEAFFDTHWAGSNLDDRDRKLVIVLLDSYAKNGKSA